MKIKNIILYFLMVGGVTFFLFFMTSSAWIGYEIKQRCEVAVDKYGGECVEALAKNLEDEEAGLKEKNRAVWSLGQLGDKRALPTLKKYYTGEECDHDKFICQYELKKAIKLLEGGFNATRIIRLDD